MKWTCRLPLIKKNPSAVVKYPFFFLCAHTARFLNSPSLICPLSLGKKQNKTVLAGGINWDILPHHRPATQLVSPGGGAASWLLIWICLRERLLTALLALFTWWGSDVHARCLPRIQTAGVQTAPPAGHWGIWVLTASLEGNSTAAAEGKRQKHICSCSHSENSLFIIFL